MHLVIGPSSVALGHQLEVALSVPASEAKLQIFPDGESCCRIELPDDGAPVVIVHGTHAPQDRHIQQLYQLIDVAAARRRREIICVVPYFAYARQDRRVTPRDPLSAQLVVKAILTLGATKVITVDIHNPKIFEAYASSATNLSAALPTAVWLRTQRFSNPILISPDHGGERRIRAIGKELGWPVHVCDKRKDETGRTWYEGIGREFAGHDAIVIDDLCSSGSTLVPLAGALREAGAKKLLVGTMHFFADPAAVEKKIGAGVELFSTNSIPSAISKVDLAPMLADYIQSYLSPEKQRVSV
jgi:ribose-phosphate pyrophosphokinase